ncbi:type II toxin-antitoxin system ParD family antitoxin [Flavobacteriaceae bacterium]|nr:type II toxin-antitoxin system ParD family antitoxin [Flavobacteriaceae bacterium]MDA9970420.1 type II toxin-antitoxin system ParD family antitoxin [Flavobacteriaceae bacterium]MDB9874011.1 type II toxin-antitoxin system ParD family antitoxin [Flavobacteriaceae bacterium]
MNVSLTKKQKDYISNQVESGDFQNASELVRDALRLHEVYRHRVIMDLRAEIEKGWEGPSSKRDISAIINEKRLEKERRVNGK